MQLEYLAPQQVLLRKYIYDTASLDSVELKNFVTIVHNIATSVSILNIVNMMVGTVTHYAKLSLKNGCMQLEI